MKEDFQVGPYFVQIGLARDFQDAVQYGQHPGWYAAQVGNILFDGDFCDAVALFFKVREECDTLLGNS